MAQVQKEIMSQEEYLRIYQEKFGEDVVNSIFYLRKRRLALRPISRQTGISHEEVRIILKYCFPELLHLQPPKNLYLVEELSKLSNSHPQDLKKFLKRHGIKPARRFQGRLLFREDAIQLISGLLNRPCKKCGKPVQRLWYRAKHCKVCLAT
jgi:hypothetical protein